MRSWSTTLTDMIASREATRCFMIELVNSITLCGTVRLTDIDKDMVVSGHTFQKSPGFNVTKFSVANGGRPSGLDFDLPFDAEGPIYTDHVKRGAWRGADVTVWIGDFTNPSDREILASGFVGLTAFTDRLAGSIQMITKADALSDIILPTVQPKCWYQLGSGLCPVDIGPLTSTATVATVTNNGQFTVTTAGALDYTHGKATFTSGDNAGAKDNIRLWVPGTKTIHMVTAFPFDIKVGDTLTISPGCKQDRPACVAYGAKNSYPGFDFTPGDLLGGN